MVFVPEQSKLASGIWYGPILDKQTIAKLKEGLVSITTERECILSVMEILKSGDFSVKSILIGLMNSTEDEEVLNLCIRLFCSIATNEDLLNNENMAFLSKSSDTGVNTFAACAPTTLSYHVVPYLLVLLEEWEDIYVEQTIRDSLDSILNYTSEISEQASIDEIGEIYLDKMKKLDKGKYYYKQDAVFPGNQAKQLISQAFSALKQSDDLKMSIIPSLLSIWSGEKCPVSYNTRMNQSELEAVTKYVTILSEKEWVVGNKYFYGHRVE